jgi:hypothetical protein
MAGGTILTFVSAESGAPVAGVDVAVGEQRYRTDGTGSVQLADAVMLPATIEASSNEYLLRETLLRPGDAPTLSLWPRRSPTGLDEEHTRALVYTEAAGGAPGARSLHRVMPGRISVVPAPGIAADPEALEALRAAADALSLAAGGVVEFVVDPSASSDVVVRTEINPHDPAMGGHAALTYRTVDSGRITSARIVFLSLEVARQGGIVMHELGHTFGLEHSTDRRDLMYPIVTPGKRLSDREALAIDLMLKRRPGNRFPDNDREGGRALSTGIEVVACH